MIRLRHISEKVAAAIAAITLVGCTVGPKYKQPAYPAPPAFRGADEATISSAAEKSLGDQQWAEVFREPELQALIHTALANNYDLRIAAQRILEQQAQVKITRSRRASYIAGVRRAGCLARLFLLAVCTASLKTSRMCQQKSRLFWVEDWRFDLTPCPTRALHTDQFTLFHTLWHQPCFTLPEPTYTTFDTCLIGGSQQAGKRL
jgi:hypothetical protein